MWAQKLIGLSFSLILITIISPRIVRADQWPSTSTSANSAEFFPKGTWTFQTDGTFIRGVGQPRYEQLSGGQVSTSYYVRNRASFCFEMPLYYVNQSGPNAVIGGFDLLARIHVLEFDRFSIYADTGAGAVFSSNSVPRHGTIYNFTPQVGVGATCMIAPSTFIFGGCRYWHLSNAGLSGTRRNPSIDQAIMGYVGIGWKF